MALRNFIVRTLTVSLQKIVPVLRIGARSVVFVSRPFLFPAYFFRNFFLSASPRLILDKSQVSPYFEEMQLSGRIVVYSILGCPHCMRAKNTLQELGLPYTDVRLDIFPQSVREEVKQRTGRTSVPQIFFNNIHIGGNDDLQKLIQDKDRLASLIELVKTTAPPEDAPVPPDPSLAIDSDPSHLVCEIDEYAELVAELKASGIIQNHRQGLKTLKNTFRGNDFVNWIVSTKQLEREQALEMGQQLIDRHFGHNLKSEQVFHDDDVYYRLMEDDNTSALNGGVITECEPQSASIIGEEIRNMILRLYGAFLSRDGKAVDYKGISGSSEFQSYLRLTKELQRVKILDASREEKLAFFINIYNALVIHANIVLGPPVNLWQRYKFFNTVKYIISGYEYSLQDIENGILRGNRKGVGMFTRPFSKSDPRLKIALEECEPLIHFALVCGAKSCPPIKTYKPEGVMEQLLLAANSFFEGPDGCQIDLGRNTVSLSMIFKWYQEDFGKNTDELTFYGDVDELRSPKEVENAIYISNHQSTMDWILGCSLALRRGALNRCRYVVKDGLKYFPLYGFYLTQHGVLYIKRAGKFQARKAQLQLQNMVKHKTPLWMVVFPEGTRYNSELKDVIARSQKFSLEQGTQELHQVLYPRTKATYVCLQELHDYVTSFYDVTIAYNNTRDAATGQRTTSPGMPDFLSGHTSKVHMHIRKIPIKEIPLEEEEFKKWLLEQFHLKDKLLQHFYSIEDQDKAAFPGPGYQIPLSFKSTVPSFLLWGGSFAACMAFQETRNIYWKVGLASLVTGLIWVSVRS